MKQGSRTSESAAFDSVPKCARCVFLGVRARQTLQMEVCFDVENGTFP